MTETGIGQVARVTVDTANILLRAEARESVAAVRDLLADAGFSASRICERLGIETIHDFHSVREGRPRRRMADALDLLIRLFLDCEPVSQRQATALLQNRTAALVEAGLLKAVTQNRWESTAMLYPAGSLHIASDSHRARADGSRRGLRRDAVYPAIASASRLFLDGLPSTPCEALLDLCTGTGVAALLLAGRARHAWAVDITERAVRFAEFNAALNGRTNVTVFRGDLYEPVRGLTFDCVVAHPPFVPTRRPRYVYSDGGIDGEGVTHRVIEGLQQHLRPGGLFYCTCAATDRDGAPLEARIRDMLGAVSTEFDVAVVASAIHDGEEYCAELAARRTLPVRDLRHLRCTFHELAVESIVVGAIVVVRHAAVRPPITLRRRMGVWPAADAVAHVLRWETGARDPMTLRQLLDSRPRLPSHVQSWAAERSQLTMRQARLATDRPFPLMLDLSPGTARLIELTDGTATVRHIAGRLRHDGMLPDDVPDEAIAHTVGSLIADGLLTVD